MAETEDLNWQRLDKFLFFARLCKTRTQATQLIAGGLVRINRQPTQKPHARLRVDDVLTLPLPGNVKVIRINALANRRGNAAVAQILYEEII